MQNQATAKTLSFCNEEIFFFIITRFVVDFLIE